MPARERTPRWLRPVAGALAGLAGGCVFGVLMSLPALFNEAFFGGTGMMTLLGRLLFPDGGSSSFHLLYVWLVHALNSLLFGVAFAFLVRPGRLRRVLPLGLAWGFALWLLASFLLLRALTGAPLVLDAAALLNLVGHLAYGATLGLAYAAFYRGEVQVSRGEGGFRPVPPAAP